MGLILGTEWLQTTALGDLGMIAIAAYGLAFALGSASALIFVGQRLLRAAASEQGSALGLLPAAGSIWFVVPIAFGQVCRELFLQFGGFAGVHSTSVTAALFGNPDWSIFAFSWLLSTMTFNASQIFGWVTTPIQATAWWSGILIVLFSIVSDVVLVAGLINLLQLILHQRSLSES